MNGTQTQILRGGSRFAPYVAFGGVVLAAAIVAGVALGGGDGNGNGGALPPAPSAPPASPIVTPVPSDQPAPTPVPTGQPSEVPGEEPSEEPTDGSDGMPIRVDLDNAAGRDVYVDVVDRSDLLVDAESGKPGDGVSVGYDTVEVENLDARTLKLTWADYPIDNALALFIDEIDGGLRFVLVQPEPTGDTDAMVSDRELILSFADPISADRVEASLQDGLDTPG